MSLKSLDFFGLKVSSFTRQELINSLKHVVRSKDSAVYYGYSLAVLSYIKKYPNYLDITSQFDVIVTDGRLFYLLAKFFGLKLKYDISIPRLTLLTLELANSEGYNVTIFGATKKSNEGAQKNILKKYPEITKCSGFDGYFDFRERKDIYGEIISSMPNILLLGLPTPQKQIVANELREVLASCIIIPCGGMIDVLAGNEKLTPIWIKKIGLASFYRHIQHPKRLTELFVIFFLAIKVFTLCIFLKFIKHSKSINISKLI